MYTTLTLLTNSTLQEVNIRTGTISDIMGTTENLKPMASCYTHQNPREGKAVWDWYLQGRFLCTVCSISLSVCSRKLCPQLDIEFLSDLAASEHSTRYMMSEGKLCVDKTGVLSSASAGPRGWDWSLLSPALSCNILRKKLQLTFHSSSGRLQHTADSVASSFLIVPWGFCL